MEAFFQHNHKSRLSLIQKLDYPAHLHRAVEFGYLEKGESLLTVDGKEYPLKAGDVFVIFPDQVHLFEKSREIQGYLAIARTEEFSLFDRFFAAGVPKTPIIDKKSLFPHGIDRLFESAAQDPDLPLSDVCRGYLTVLLGKLLPLTSLREQTGSKRRELQRVLAFLEENFREPLTRESIARAAGISESTLSHLFSASLRTSLPRYLTLLRLEEALRLLSESDLPITALAAQAGFSSLRSFNRAFRERYGKSPTRFRREDTSL